MSLYSKTALKKIKKDELIQMFLDLQAQKVNDSMDEENEKLKEDITYMKHQKSVQNEKLKEFMDEINSLKAENQKLKKFKSDVIDALQFDDDLDDEDYITSIKEMEEKYDINKEENEALKKQKIPDDIISAFTGLTNNWWGDEEQFYSETFEPEQQPEDIPTDKLEPCNYRDLRILDEWFQKINQK